MSAARDPIVLLLLALAVANTVVLVTILRRSRVKEPACGGCGYAVRGLESLRCPECGGDLERVGIITSRMAPTLPAWLLAVLAVVVVTALMPYPARMIMSLRDVIDPPVTQTTQNATLAGRDVPTLTMTCVSTPTTESIVLGTPDARDGVRIASPDDPALDAWLATLDAAHAAPGLRQMLRGWRTQGVWSAQAPFNSVSINSNATMLPRVPWVKPVLDGSILGLWLAAIVLIVVRMRRRMRREREVA